MLLVSKKMLRSTGFSAMSCSRRPAMLWLDTRAGEHLGCKYQPTESQPPWRKSMAVTQNSSSVSSCRAYNRAKLQTAHSQGLEDLKCPNCSAELLAVNGKEAVYCRNCACLPVGDHSGLDRHANIP